MKKSAFLLVTFMLLNGLFFAQVLKTEKWPNGQLKSSGSVKYDVPLSANASKQEILRVSHQLIKVGVWQYWFQNGQLQAEETYTEGTRTGIKKSWYASGRPEAVIDLNGLTASYWFENGQKQSSGAIMSDGNPTGPWTLWHDNGVKNSEGVYDRVGYKQGIWMFWDSKGQIIGQQNYVNGAVH